MSIRVDVYHHFSSANQFVASKIAAEDPTAAQLKLPPPERMSWRNTFF